MFILINIDFGSPTAGLDGIRAHEHSGRRRLQPPPTPPPNATALATEKILKGDPEQTLFNHYNSPCGQMKCRGLGRRSGQWTVNYTEHEYCEIVQGVSVLRDDREGNAKTLRAGDRFVIPAGFTVAPGKCWNRVARSTWCSNRKPDQQIAVDRDQKPCSSLMAGFFYCSSTGA
jgi:uncharacterized cupin superfamily protein